MVSPNLIVMALDVGDSSIGVAISDELGITAQPLAPLRNQGPETVSEIAKLVEQKRVQTIVVGLPVKLSGEESEQTQKVRKFIDTLATKLQPQGVTITPWDERLTTVQAERVLQGSKLKNRRRRQALDTISASLILQSYLMAQGI